MTNKLLDPRTKAHIMALLNERAREYAPMWRYNKGAADPGAAIFELFGDLFYQTLDRFNQLPGKLYTEFLNLLGVPSPSVMPSSGYMRFGVGAPGEPVPIEKDTEVFAATEDGDNIVFSTERKIEATAASLEDVYYADAKAGIIQRLDSAKEPFFAPADGENLQFHRFAISQNEVLALKGPCKIELSLRQDTRFLEESTARRLCGAGFAAWKYWNGEAYMPFDSAAAKNGTITLEKSGPDRLMPDENGRICVYCDMAGGEGDIVLSGVSLSSSMPALPKADLLANNDIPISQDEGGYCFGHRPAPYELFYIRADDVFIKRGARVNVALDIAMIVSSTVDSEPQYVFDRRLIDKQDAVKVMPEDVYVQQVVWEYYNGTGWAALQVSGNSNPFSGKSEGDLVVLFTAPADIQPLIVNAEEGYYIRARVVNVENYLSVIPKWIVPFVNSVACSYDYAHSAPADYICAYNNAKMVEIESAANVSNLNIAVYRPMPVHPRAMYLRFSASPHAMPLSMLFDVAGEKILDSKIVFEAYRDGRFSQVRAIDRTQNLRYSGIAFLYVPERLEEAEFFGVPGYWLRMSLSSLATDESRAPYVNGITLNTVLAQQRQAAAEQLFEAGVYDANKTLELLERPVLECEVWVDERSALSAAELDAFTGQPDAALEREGNDVTRCWVKWAQTASLEQATPGQRVYEMDSFAGKIAFGDGINGKVPPQGEMNIRVRYSFGGGANGNLPAGRVNAFVGSIPRINAVSNITAMAGGEDLPPIERVEQLGNKRLRHRRIALSASDFEEMALAFPRAFKVKCFSNTDERGQRTPGHVCLVIMGREPGGERMTLEVCREVYAYLSERCDCNLVFGNRLHVVPSVEMTICVEVSVLLENPDLAAFTQQKIGDALKYLIDNTWRSRDIGAQIIISELYQAVKAIDNVANIARILPEGRFTREGRTLVTALDEGEFPFATVRSGEHTIRIG